MLVLSCNVFVFDSVLFMQLFGVAMGSRVAPTFACLFMGWLEAKMLSSWFTRGGVLPYLWRRYIDDILFFWHGTEAELLEFEAFLNSFHTTIKFKCKKGENYDFEQRKVNFLDTCIWVDSDGYIQSTLYTKPCSGSVPLTTQLSSIPHYSKHSLFHGLQT